MAVDTVDIKGVELAKVGKWAGGDGRGRPAQLDITREDLAAAVDAYSYALSNGGASAAEVPIKVGHVAAQEAFGDLADGAPAFGWVGNLRLSEDGATLIGDYLRLPAKFAAMVTSGAWRNRSIEFYRNAKWPLSAAGKTFRMVMSAVAVLGATPPAVKGLADIFAAGESDADDAERFFIASAAEDGPLSEAQAARLMDKYEALLAELEPLFRGRAGAPMFRSFATASVQQLRRIARFQPTPQEGQMRAAVLSLIGASDDADNAAALAAIPTAKPANVAALYTLALNADAALAVLAEILGVPGATPDDVIAKVRELTGGEPADPNAPADPAAPTPPGGGMASTPEIDELKQALKASQAAQAKADITLAKHLAETKVDADIQGLKLPAAARANLLSLALQGDDVLYASLVEMLPKVPTGEKGTAAASKLSEVDLTPDEIAIAKSMGNSLDDVRKTKARAAGLDLA